MLIEKSQAKIIYNTNNFATLLAMNRYLNIIISSFLMYLAQSKFLFCDI